MATSPLERASLSAVKGAFHPCVLAADQAGIDDIPQKYERLLLVTINDDGMEACKVLFGQAYGYHCVHSLLHLYENEDGDPSVPSNVGNKRGNLLPYFVSKEAKLLVRQSLRIPDIPCDVSCTRHEFSTQTDIART